MVVGKLGRYTGSRRSRVLKGCGRVGVNAGREGKQGRARRAKRIHPFIDRWATIFTHVWVFYQVKVNSVVCVTRKSY